MLSKCRKVAVADRKLVSRAHLTNRQFLFISMRKGLLAETLL